MSREVEGRKALALETAEFAFWERIAQAYPEAKSGDFPFDAAADFSAACKQAVEVWLEWNVGAENGEKQD